MRMAERCEWNPDECRASYDNDGCEREATLCVGANGAWHLCEACSAHPMFARLKKTPLVRPARKNLSGCGDWR